MRVLCRDTVFEALGGMILGGSSERIPLLTVTLTKISGPSVSSALSQDNEQWTIIATADGDTVSASTSHEMGANVIPMCPVPILAAGQLSLWAFTTLSATAFVVTKTTATGSGNASAQARIPLQRFR